LEAHHEAKLPERRVFAESLARYEPSRIVDIGCGTGLWLDLLDGVIPQTCEFVGIDSDPESLSTAQGRAARWSRPSAFLLADVEADPGVIPPGDLVLAFNILPYLPGARELVRGLCAQGKLRRLVLRQYDGGTIRLGPIAAEDRFIIDGALQAAMGPSNEFGHYEMDNAFTLIRETGLQPERVEFELTQRTAPFPAGFKRFFEATIDWMDSLLSEDAHARLKRNVGAWQTSQAAGAYFAQVDLIAVLSA
jgi:SAM-dependent methyltransferase